MDLTELQDQLDKAAHEQLASYGNQYGVAKTSQVVTVGRPESEIHRLAKEQDVDLVIVGSHGRKGFQLLLGSTANGVLHGTDVLTGGFPPLLQIAAFVGIGADLVGMARPLLLAFREGDVDQLDVEQAKAQLYSTQATILALRALLILFGLLVAVSSAYNIYHALATGDATEISEGGTISFNGTEAYDDGAIIDYAWDCGDGGTGAKVGFLETQDVGGKNRGHHSLVVPRVQHQERWHEEPARQVGQTGECGLQDEGLGRSLGGDGACRPAA